MSQKSGNSPSFDTVVNKEKLPPEITIVPRPPLLSKKRRRPGASSSLISSRNAHVSSTEFRLTPPRPITSKPTTPIKPPSKTNEAPTTTVATTAFSSEEMAEKRELLFKLEMIRKRNPALEVPEYGMTSNIDIMKTSYDMFIRRLTIDNTVEDYKHRLTFAFLVIEIAVTKLTSVNMTGFSRHHQSMMSTYEKLLVELGEKVDPEGKSRMSVEMRLGLVVGINSIIFIGTRIAFPPDVAAQFLQNLAPAPTRRMKPPEGVV